MNIRTWFLALLLCPPVVATGQTATSGRAFSRSKPRYKVGYVMLGVAGIPRAIAFYHEKLGLPITLQAEDLAFFDGGGISIAVSSEVGKEPGDSEVVFTVPHVKAAYDALVRTGIAFDQPPHSLNAQAWVANFHDPDGHRLSIYGPR